MTLYTTIRTLTKSGRSLFQKYQNTNPPDTKQMEDSHREDDTYMYVGQNTIGLW